MLVYNDQICQLEMEYDLIFLLEVRRVFYTKKRVAIK